jgi:hypothetical protein
VYSLLAELAQLVEDSIRRQQAIFVLALRYSQVPKTKELLQNIVATPLGRAVVEKVASPNAASPIADTSWRMYLLSLLDQKGA